MARRDWNTEEPEAHLLPHLRRWLDDHASDVALLDVRNEEDVLVLDLDGHRRSRHDLREVIYPLIATVAEPTTAIVERDEDGARVFDVVLAITPSQTDVFPKGHGHLVRLRVRTDD